MRTLTGIIKWENNCRHIKYRLCSQNIFILYCKENAVKHYSIFCNVGCWIPVMNADHLCSLFLSSLFLFCPSSFFLFSLSFSPLLYLSSSPSSTCCILSYPDCFPLFFHLSFSVCILDCPHFLFSSLPYLSFPSAHLLFFFSPSFFSPLHLISLRSPFSYSPNWK